MTLEHERIRELLNQRDVLRNEAIPLMESDVEFSTVTNGYLQVCTTEELAELRSFLKPRLTAALERILAELNS
jgi:hypothetical protein